MTRRFVGPVCAAARVRRPRHVHRGVVTMPGDQRPDPAPAVPSRRAEPSRVGHGAQPPARAGATPEPHVINLSAGCHTLNDLRPEGLPADLGRDAQAARGHRAGGRGRQRRHATTRSIPAAFGWAVGRRLPGPRRRRLELLELRQLAPTSTCSVATTSTRSPTARTSARRRRTRTTCGCSTAAWPGGAARRSRAPLVAGLIAAQRNVDDSRTVKQIAWSLVTRRSRQEQHPLRGTYRRLQHAVRLT